MEDIDYSYEQARTMFEIATGDLSRSQYSSGFIKFSLGNCITWLRDAYRVGRVETLEGLPNPRDVEFFNNEKLSTLIKDLSQRYFPSDLEFEAA